MSLLKVLLWPLRTWQGQRETAASSAPPKVPAENYENSMPILKVSAGGTEVIFCTPN